jgi:hypothetical protein
MARDALLDFDMPTVDSGTNYTAGSTETSDDVIDLEAADNMIGEGNPVYLKVVCTTDCTQAGSTGTLQFSLQESSDNGDSDAYANTAIVAPQVGSSGGYSAGDVIIDQALPKDLERYLRIGATVGAENITAGDFEAYLYVR